MKKIIKIFTMLFLLITVITITGCDNETPVITITGIEANTSSIPTSILNTKLDEKLDDIIIEITKSDNTKENINLDKSMISNDDLNKLKEVGSHNITINYQGFSCNITINIIKASPKSLKIDSTTIPSSILSTSLAEELNKIKMTVTRMDDSVEDVYLDKSMISEDDLALLETEGSHEVSINFEGAVTKINLNITLPVMVYQIKYNTLDAETSFTVDVLENEKVLEPLTPQKEGYAFTGWYTDQNYTSKFKFNRAITANTELYAKWNILVPNTDPTDSLEAKSLNELSGYEMLQSIDDNTLAEVSKAGYVKDYIGDFSKYIGTSYYRKVSTPEEFLKAISDAKVKYGTVWDSTNNKCDQYIIDGYNETNYTQKVHVIEIENDLNLGYYQLSDTAKATGIASDFASKVNSLGDIYKSEMFLENGISQIKIENISNLLIYSKNGAKIMHAGFKLNSTNNIVIRNLDFDGLWQWEDASSTNVGAIGDYDKFGWAYFKISFSGYVWIDHCSFGKSYDGQIDYANPVYNVAKTCFRAPYKANGGNGLHISWCEFNGGSDDEDGYLYKMMYSIEQNYLNGGNDCVYYNTLRNAGATFEEILYGLAIPQKKGFLLGDNSDDDKLYNPKMNVSFANCIFTNIEDRLPKLRAGDCFMYNCIFDNSVYYEYREILQNLEYTPEGSSSVLKSAKNIIAALKTDAGKNAGWKCALVSQGIVPSQGASVNSENCIFKGIEYFIKNNDSGYGSYKFKNCSYQLGKDDTVYQINSNDDILSDWCSGSLKTDIFEWNTPDKEAPFTVNEIDLDNLYDYLNNSLYGVGTNTNYQELLTTNKYYQ